MSDITAVTPPVAVPTPPAPELRDAALQGRLDGAAVLKLRDQVTEALQDRPATVLVDISGVTQVTASGLAGVLELLHLARSRGGDVRLYGVSLAIADAQEAARLTSVTRIYVRRDQAALGGPARPQAASDSTRSRRRPVQVLRGVVASKRAAKGGALPAQAGVVDRAGAAPDLAQAPSHAEVQPEVLGAPAKAEPSKNGLTKAGVNR